jgi:hypothetical protein
MAVSRLDGHRYALKVMKHRYANIDKIKKVGLIKALITEQSKVKPGMDI